MADKAKFIQEMSIKYAPKGDFITLGKGMLDGDVVTEVNVTIPLKTINRHGLIAVSYTHLDVYKRQSV